jgi:hypothetical protein
MRVLEGEPRYLVWSHEHAAWWRVHSGYTRTAAKAGRWTRAEAIEICRNALPGQWREGLPFPEIPVAELDIEAMLERPTS